MEKLLHTLIFGVGLFVSIATIGQPVLTAADLNIVLGDNFYTYRCNYMSEGPAGPNQTWDLSLLTAQSGALTTAVNVASSGYSFIMGNANIAVGVPQNYSFYLESDSAHQYYGNGIGSAGLYYYDPEDLLHLPITYNDTFIDTYKAYYYASLFQEHKQGTVTVTADGYGTLKTPAGTFTNVLRVHQVETEIDSIYPPGWYWSSLTLNTDIYLWYLKDNHNPIASVGTFPNSGGTVGQRAYYLGNPTAVNESSQLLRSFSIYPNPATDKVMLVVDLNAKQHMEVRVYNTLGSLVKTINSSDGLANKNNCYLDVAGLPEGIYFAQLLLNNNVAAEQKFILEK